MEIYAHTNVTAPPRRVNPYSLAIIVDRYWPSLGGVEQAAQSLAASLPAICHTSIITHCSAKGTSLYKSFRIPSQQPTQDPTGHPIVMLNPGKLGRLALLPLLIWNIPMLRKKIAARLFDALYAWYSLVFHRQLEKLLQPFDLVHCISTGYLARLVTDICLKQEKHFFHEPFIHFGRWGDSPAQLQAYTAADAIICPTFGFRDLLLEHLDPSLPVTIEVIPPVVPEPLQPSLKVSPVPGRFILFLGRREAHKGLAELLVAFNGLEQLASLIIAGPGERVRTRNMAIFDLGEVDEMMKTWLLSSCELLCVPSLDETFGIVFTEAMSYGKPVVGFDIAPLNEIVEPGVSGILPPADEPEHLHFAIKQLLEDEPLRKEMGAAARQRYHDLFSSNIVIGELAGLYHEQLGKTVSRSL